MIKYFDTMFTFSKKKKDLPRIPKGQRVYAVGDVHGRADLFAQLVTAIEEEILVAAANGVECQVILLGDLVDRGPDSAGVIDLAKRWAKTRNVRVLCGNHEEMFLKSFDDKEMLKHFLRHGGRETLMSYGVDRKIFSKPGVGELHALMQDVVPGKHRKFMAKFEDMIRFGDFVFVHAGIEPGVPLSAQKARTLRWIREPFLSHKKSHGAVVVHGHTITDEVVDTGNRIGVDTGAYATGRLTALVLEGSTRRYLAAEETKAGAIKIKGAAMGG